MDEEVDNDMDFSGNQHLIQLEEPQSEYDTNRRFSGHKAFKCSLVSCLF